MFQVFHTDIAKVDQDVAYAAMVIHVFCKCLFPMFYLFFQTYIASVRGISMSVQAVRQNRAS
jgi:hypothetical protein